MYKITLLLMLGVIIFSSFMKPQNDKVVSIDIYAVLFSIRTASNVNCDEFFRSFSSQIDTFHVVDKVNVSKILKMLENIKVNNTVNRDIDTRAKMSVHFKSGKTDEYCFDNFTHCFKNSEPQLLFDEAILFHIDSMVISKFQNK